MTLGEKLTALRKEQGLTLKEVASAVNVTISAYSNYEHNFRVPSIDIIKRICLFFDVSADYIIDLEDETGAKIKK